MKIALLVNSFREGIRLRRQLAGASPVQLRILVLKKPSEGFLSFVTRILGGFIIQGDRIAKLTALIRKEAVFIARPLSIPSNIERLKGLAFDVGIHRTENIYRSQTLACFRMGVLNAHIASLPAYRGRSVFEWTVLKGDIPTITVFFIDEGIDTGSRGVISRTYENCSFGSTEKSKKFLFQEAVNLYAEALKKLQQSSFHPFEIRGPGTRYYVMSTLFRETADGILHQSHRSAVR